MCSDQEFRCPLSLCEKINASHHFVFEPLMSEGQWKDHVWSKRRLKDFVEFKPLPALDCVLNVKKQLDQPWGWSKRFLFLLLLPFYNAKKKKKMTAHPMNIFLNVRSQMFLDSLKSRVFHVVASPWVCSINYNVFWITSLLGKSQILLRAMVGVAKILP